MAYHAALALTAVGTASAWTAPSTSATHLYNASKYSEPPLDYCLHKLELYAFFNRVVSLLPNGTGGRDLTQQLNATELPGGAHDQSAPLGTATLFGIGVALFAFPLLFGDTKALEIAVGLVAAFFGALVAVHWLLNGGDQIIQDGEGVLEHRRGAHPTDSCLYAIGLAALGAACSGILASQVIELGFFVVGAGVAGYAAYALRQRSGGASDSEQMQLAQVSLAAMAGGGVCAYYGAVVVIEVLSALGAYLIADSVLAAAGVEGWYAGHLSAPSLTTSLLHRPRRFTQ